MYPTPEQLAADETTPPNKLRILAYESVELARLVATNPSAEPDLLGELASSEDKVTREGVAKNPNTPTDVLLKLAGDFPQQFFSNPVLSLLMLENPNLATDISYWSLLKLLKQDDAPEWFLACAAMHANSLVLEAVAKHKHASEQVLVQLAIKSRYDPELGLCIAQRKDVSQTVLEKLAQHGAGSVRLHLATYPKIPVRVLEILVENPEPNWNLRVAIETSIAKNPNTPLNVLQALIKVPYTKVKNAIAKRSDLTKHLIIELAMDYRVHTMNFLPQNPHIPSSWLEEMAEHPNERVRQMVARHPNTPAHLLVLAANNLELRQFVAENPNTPASTLQELAMDSRGDIQAAVARNANTPGYVLDILGSTPFHDLLLARHPNTSSSTLQKVLWRLALDERLSVRKYVAQHNQAPVSILTQWAKSSPELRPWIASNFRTPSRILEELAKDTSKDVRYGVAKNINTPPHILKKLAEDWRLEVRQAVAQNPQTPGDILEILIKDWHLRSFIAQNPNTPATALEQLTQFFRYDWYIVQHPNSPPQLRQRLLEEFSTSVVETERLFVARHADTPVEILEHLAEDEDPVVSKSAKRSLRKRGERG
ncbi:Leucine rich repeat protein [Rivularia sp. PCC 7116]|uniref:variant leucine-rich repeat-containing protein n=1 Tax=Rivularia sp. PCC 7116 TaxID=373994 RepID=UPI00029F0389|nr:hypothetical protein [Rivularia sp. PCC 7116]AFY55299.1 Leucine rich repeat protein [Rivularia sp. PCC 7116]